MTGAPKDAADPTSGHSARYCVQNVEHTADGRLVSRVAARNLPPILVALVPWLGARSGPVLEIGCGTGQHAASLALAFPDLQWRASDVDAGHRDSAAAWAGWLGAPERSALALDGADWAGAAAVLELGPLTAVVSMNVIHIAPPEVAAGIVAGAGARLAPGGLLIFYGPFREGGRHTGPGNARFDAGLRAENPDWGLRDTDDLRVAGQAAGLAFAALIAMPANNRLLILRRD